MKLLQSSVLHKNTVCSVLVSDDFFNQEIKKGEWVKKVYIVILNF